MYICMYIYICVYICVHIHKIEVLLIAGILLVVKAKNISRTQPKCT